MLTFEALLLRVPGPTFWAVTHGSMALGAAERILAARVLNDAGVGANSLDTRPVRRAVWVHAADRFRFRDWWMVITTTFSMTLWFCIILQRI